MELQKLKAEEIEYQKEQRRVRVNRKRMQELHENNVKRKQEEQKEMQFGVNNSYELRKPKRINRQQRIKIVYNPNTR